MNTNPMFHECSTRDDGDMPTGWTWPNTLAAARAYATGLRPRVAPSNPTTKTPDSCYRFTATCPRCDQPLEHLTSSRPPAVISQRVMAIAHCPPCRETFEITVELTSTRVRQMRAAYHDRAVEAHARIAEHELAGRR